MIGLSRANRTVPLAFGAAALALLIVGAISYRGLQDSAESAKWVRHSHEVIETIQDFRFAIDTTDSSARAFVLTGEQKYLDSFNTNKANAETAQSSLHILTADNLEQQRHLPLLQTLTAEKLQASEALIEQRRSNGSGVVPEALSSDSGQQTMTKLMSVVRLLQNEESRLLDLRETEATQRFEQAQTVLIFGTIFGLLIAMVAGWSVYRDMSARSRVENALRESEERYSMLLDGVEDYAIYLIDAQGRVASWNSGAERTKGYSSHEIVGRHYSCFFPEADIKLGRPEQILRVAAANGRYEEQSTRVRKDGSQFLASLSFTALRDKDGNLRGFSGISHDLSKTNESEARYRGLLEAAPDAMVVVDQEGEIVLLNVQAEKRFGYRRDELLGQKVTNIIPVGFAERLIADGTRSAAEALAQQIGTGIELTALRKNGSEFPIEIMLSPLESAEGTLVTAAIRDISVRKAADEHLAQMEGRYRGLLEAAPDAMFVVDQEGKIVLLNVQGEKQFGYRRDELLGQKVTNIIPEGFAERLVADALRSTEEALAQHIGTGIELSALRKNGSEFPIEIMLSPLQSAEGILVTAAVRDITARKQAELTLLHSVDELRRSARQITHTAEHDFLTGLPNRMLFNDRLRQAIALAKRNQKQVAVLFLDLDGFKHINDSLGHATGDRLLQSVAGRLVECVRDSDTVSRQGGDEFVVLLWEIERAEDAAISARRILSAVSQAHSVDARELHITTSIGVSVYPEDGMDAEALIKNADTAMYQAKETGRQSFRFFEPAMNVRAVERQSIEESLRRALDRDELAVHYQPKVNLSTGAIVGAEALLRWTHPTRGPVPPDQFIPVAEDCGLILPIGNWVLRQACRRAQAWSKAGLPKMTMAVNVSAMEFQSENFLAGVFAILAETGLDPRLLELELTEGVLIKRVGFTASILQLLRERGVQIAIDDFGTGYSSLSYLRKFPVDALKIDRSFVRQIGVEGEDMSIVTAIINMAQSLKLRVVAEGVETLDALQFLQDRCCDEAQGFYFSPAVPHERFVEYLEFGAFFAKTELQLANLASPAEKCTVEPFEDVAPAQRAAR